MQRLRVIVLPILLGLCASLFTLVTNMPSADACSVMPPQLEVSPTSELQPGDWMKIQGYGFYDVISVPYEDEFDPDTGELIPPHSCMGIEFVPQEVTISWIGSIEEPLTRVKGPEFAVEVQVPAWAEPGWAAVQADWVMVEVQVGKAGPEPCPLFDDGSPSNPDLWPGHCPHPCDEIVTNQIRPACPEPCLGGPAIDPWCPEPCPVYVHDADVDQLPWGPECPEPCVGGPAVDVWCPEPCPVYVTDGAGLQVMPPHCPEPCLGGPAVDVWCPEPCPLNAADAPLRVSPPHCPDPCLGGPTVGVWCPEPCVHIMGFEGDRPPVWDECQPEPCGWPLDDDLTSEQDLRPIMPCPEPCGDYVNGPNASRWGCPTPCLDQPHTGDVCPIPLPVPPPFPEPLPEPQPFPEPCWLDSDGNEICLTEPGQTGDATDSTSAPTATTATPTATGPAVVDPATGIAPVIAQPGPADPPPAPRIDFDGCRSDGEQLCITLLQEQAIAAIRSVVTALFAW